MRVVLQRVREASVKVDGQIVGHIGQGWLVLFGVHKGDSIEGVEWLVEKCVNLRAFADLAGKMNLSILDIGGEMLVVSQFTLAGDCRKGRRPGFDQAAAPQDANGIYEAFCEGIAASGVPIERGVFQADMQVSLINDGPVTFVIDYPPTAR